MVLPALTRGGYSYETQVNIGQRLGGGKHIADVVASKDGRKWLISLKWQQVGGTAEQNVLFEVISLAEAMLSGEYEGTYLVLGGQGWTLREFYVGGGLNSHLVQADSVKLVTLEAFVAMANRGEL